MTPLLDLDRIAAYPRRESEATADAMARALAVRAQAARPHHHMASGQRVMALDEVVGLYGIVALLRALTEHAPAAADATAQALWRAWEDGGEIADWLWEWLTEYDYDPAQITGRCTVQGATDREPGRYGRV